MLLAAITFVPETRGARNGIVDGILRASNGRGNADSPIVITGSVGFRETIRTGENGEFFLVLPYGEYRFSGVRVWVAPVEITRLDLVRDPSGAIHMRGMNRSNRSDTPRSSVYSEACSIQCMMLSREASSVTEPLDFAGLSDNHALQSPGDGHDRFLSAGTRCDLTRCACSRCSWSAEHIRANRVAKRRNRG